LRRRQNLVELKSRRNVYQRPSCEFTLLRLLETQRIDALLRPTPGTINEMTVPAQALRDEWLQKMLEAEYAAYEAAELPQKHEILVRTLVFNVRSPGGAAAVG